MVRAGHLGGNIRGGDPSTYEPAVWDYLIRVYKLKTMMDLGCGEGISTQYFAERGVQAIGVDGLWRNSVNTAGAPILVHDLTKSPVSISKIQLVWSCEVAEHIDQLYTMNFLASLACGEVVAMTASNSERGYHHVNPQPTSYWIALMDLMGYDLKHRKTRIARGLAKWEFFKKTGMIFERRPR